MKSIAVLSVLLLSGAGATAACSSSTDTPAPTGGDASTGDGGDSGAGGFALEVACADTQDDVYGDPGPLPAVDPSVRGAIVKCSKAADISRDELVAAMSANGYVGRPPTSGAHVYRVLYRTERGTSPATPGVSSAVVFVPDTPRSGSLPVIVASHGTRGQAGVCTPSKTDPVDGDMQLMGYPLVGSGYAVILPDLAGYAHYGAAGNPPSGYAGAVDVGQSTLDGARALRAMFKSTLSDKVVIMGHSQGGHTALSALALHESYGAGGTVVGVVTYAPLWLAQRSWGALFVLANNYPLKTAALPNSVSIWYHYTNGELMEPGHGIDVFAADKRDAIKHFIDNDCSADRYPDLEALGTDVRDFFDPTFQAAITLPAASSGIEGCSDEPTKNALCKKWMTRYAADRPHLTGQAAKVPVLLAYGGKDGAIPPDRMACVFDRLTSDGSPFDVCFQPDTDHSGIVRNKADYANDWIAHVALGEPAPAACPYGRSALADDAGTPIACNAIPPND